MGMKQSFDAVSFALSKEHVDKALEELSGKVLLEVTPTKEEDDKDNDQNNTSG